MQSVFFDRHTPVDVAGKIDHYEADPHEALDYYPYGMVMRRGFCDSCWEDAVGAPLSAPTLAQTFAVSPVTPESYPPQTAQKVDNWFVAPVSGPTNKVTMAWNGTGGGMDLTCTIPISSGQSEMGIAIGVATPTHETYTIRFSVDLNNAGTLQAKVIRYNSSSHTTYTTLTTMTVDASSNYQINFTGGCG